MLSSVKCTVSMSILSLMQQHASAHNFRQGATRTQVTRSSASSADLALYRARNFFHNCRALFKPEVIRNEENAAKCQAIYFSSYRKHETES